MASRKEQKEQARVARLAAERAHAERTQRNRRMLVLGGVIAAVVVIIAVAIAISSNGSSTSSPVTSTQQKQDEAQVKSLLAGIPQSGTTLGKASAPVTVIYYGDLECPVCQAFTLGEGGGGFPQLVSQDVRQGKVKIIYRSFCTATCNNHPQSVFNDQQVAAYAAGMQNQFWDYAELFYREQQDETSDYVNESFLDGLAAQTAQVSGLKVATWHSDRGDPLLAQVQADGAAATSDGVTGTPTVFVKGPKGQLQVASSVPSYAQIEQTIKQTT
jgi:protein-disulfide isomerase